MKSHPTGMDLHNAGKASRLPCGNDFAGGTPALLGGTL